MNIEDLSKTQLLLLTILVNFVTSIATGVMTVSLLDQAPATVVQTVNRIVDHTIETVSTQVPAIGKEPAPVPSSEELLTSAIAADAARSVRVRRSGSDSSVAFGVYVPGVRSVFSVGSNLPNRASIAFADGTALDAEKSGADGMLVRYVFVDGAQVPQAPSGRLVPLSELKQGQSVIALNADGGAVTGIVARTGDALYANLPAVPAGAGAVNLAGDIIGISMGDGRFFGADRMTALVPAP